MSDPREPRPSAAEQRAFLLDDVEDAARERVEADLFTRPEAREELLALEHELAEAYLDAALTDPERAAFEARLAKDPRLAITLRVVRGLDAAEAPAPAPRRWLRRLLWAAPVAAALALALFVWPAPRPEEGPRMKGGPEEAQVQLRCLPRCEVGARLALDVRPPPGRPHLAAFARRGDDPVIWFEPTREGRTEPAPAEGGVWPHAYPLEGAAGPLDVYVVFSAGARTRDEVAAAMGEDLSGSPKITVVRRRITVEARP